MVSARANRSRLILARPTHLRVSFGRYVPFVLAIVATILAAFNLPLHPSLWIVVAAGGSLILLGIYDLIQRSHSVRRNYPITGLLRWLFEAIRPQIRQYLIEADNEQSPFSRSQRSLVYARAKNEGSERAFGTQLDVYESGYEFIAHSTRPAPRRRPGWFPRLGRRPPVRAAIFSFDLQHLRSELRFIKRQCDPCAQPGSTARWVRPGHRRGEHQPLSLSLWRRPDLGDWERIFWLPDSRWELRPGRLRGQSDLQPGQNGRNQAQSGRKTWPWRHSPSGQGDSAKSRLRAVLPWGRIVSHRRATAHFRLPSR